MSDPARWAFINHREIIRQAHDIRPARGGADTGSGPPSVQRAIARRVHQMKQKEWSQERGE
ncbi:MAG: hypothetical protein QOD75_547 [Blastocatellia bacterium]|jgi:hypothetical protein|nr:hypothetical protein [Blastocatellia bacterium]